MSVVLPSSLSFLLRSSSAVGFCGSRSSVPPSALWLSVSSLVSPAAVVSCGCVGGLCGLARGSFPSAVVFSASAFGSGRGAFARRSVALVSSVAASPSSLWVSFPARSCPSGLFPSSSGSRCFCGLGSGSWASLALAVGRGVPSFVWLPAGVSAPLGWGFSSLGGGWFFRPSDRLF